MAEPLLFVVRAGGALGARVLFGRRRRRAWEKAMESCGLQIRQSSRGEPLTAQAGPVTVRIQPDGTNARNTWITVSVSGPPELQQVRFRPETPSVKGREIEIGDASFDSSFFIQGTTPWVLAVFDAETRRLLLPLSHVGRVEMFSGHLQANLPNRQLPELLPLLVDASRLLARPLDVRRRLAENARGDPMAGVRLQNLLSLAREFPGNPETVERLRAACSDPSPEIRLRAAEHLGAEGRGVLHELAESLANDSVSARALSILGQDLPFERVKVLLDKALAQHRLLVARACLESLGKSRDDAAVLWLAKVLKQGPGELAPAAAEALGKTGNPAAEPPLIRALERADDDLRAAAANALGRVGSATAVLPLQEAAERSRRSSKLRRAARQAIAEIQSRLPGASPGQLSLAGAEVGQLSFAEAEAGQLSLTSDPAGQVSLSGIEEERS
ncbi:MAG TPA: HEAT repeat domain-containing protein [Thermoanaerobaculia bacterium]|nr:HEAT repeat domain-containing protein [Thermoanaerobaculia bacterium]